jgi:hypothetical protein
MIEAKPTIDIKELGIFEPKAQEYFPCDLDMLLSDREWENIMQDMNFIIENNRSLGDAIYFASQINIAFPQRKAGLPNVPFLDLLQKKSDLGLDHLKLTHPADVKILYPDINIEELFKDVVGLNKFPTIESIKNEIGKSIEGNEIPSIINNNVFKALIFHPEQLDEIGKIPGLKGLMLDEIRKDREIKDYRGIAHDAAPFKILYGNKELGLSEDDWNGLKSTFNEVKSRMPDMSKGEFLHLATNITILAAERFEMTDKGLNITFPQKSNNLEIDQLVPNWRRF